MHVRRGQPNRATPQQQHPRRVVARVQRGYFSRVPPLDDVGGVALLSISPSTRPMNLSRLVGSLAWVAVDPAQPVASRYRCRGSPEYLSGRGHRHERVGMNRAVEPSEALPEISACPGTSAQALWTCPGCPGCRRLPGSAGGGCRVDLGSPLPPGALLPCGPPSMPPGVTGGATSPPQGHRRRRVRLVGRHRWSHARMSLHNYNAPASAVCMWSLVPIHWRRRWWL